MFFFLIQNFQHQQLRKGGGGVNGFFLDIFSCFEGKVRIVFQSWLWPFDNFQKCQMLYLQLRNIIFNVFGQILVETSFFVKVVFLFEMVNISFIYLNQFFLTTFYLAFHQVAPTFCYVCISFKNYISVIFVHENEANL